MAEQTELQQEHQQSIVPMTTSLAKTPPTPQVESWGRYPIVRHRTIVKPRWQREIPALDQLDGSVLAYGYGRSYGDSCLNAENTLIDMSGLRRMISFDEQTGLLRCEAGVMLADIVEAFIPRGWFLSVTPGTKYISVAGAIANDVHGKNHHKAGTFGCHVTQFELLRSNGERLLCSAEQNSAMFRATIGGLGLTGLITWAELQLRRIPGPYIDEERIKFSSIEEFFEISKYADEKFEYTASWLDCISVGKSSGRGFSMLGNHATVQPPPGKQVKPKAKLTIPIDAPSFALNPLTVRLFNTVIYNMQRPKQINRVVPYDGFFYPLDAILMWNRMYGKAGFLQYQFVIPYNDNYKALKEILDQITSSGQGSFLVVFKTFGDKVSPGLLSFPRRGVTLALDFPYRGTKTLRLLDRLDGMVRAAGGVLYPAKDARMSGDNFKAFYPQWQEFTQYIDPKFSSSFWRRVMR